MFVPRELASCICSGTRSIAEDEIGHWRQARRVHYTSAQSIVHSRQVLRALEVFVVYEGATRASVAQHACLHAPRGRSLASHVGYVFRSRVGSEGLAVLSPTCGGILPTQCSKDVEEMILLRYVADAGTASRSAKVIITETGSSSGPDSTRQETAIACTCLEPDQRPAGARMNLARQCGVRPSFGSYHQGGCARPRVK